MTPRVSSKIQSWSKSRFEEMLERRLAQAWIEAVMQNFFSIIEGKGLVGVGLTLENIFSMFEGIGLNRSRLEQHPNSFEGIGLESQVLKNISWKLKGESLM